ncbi:MAG TPA: hypothetical protein VFQ45_01945 [Longimicrobium sp.]|nr:hypothetical protein [Longimicrobium sp.]
METLFILWILAIVFLPALLRRFKQQQGGRGGALGDPGSRAPRGHTYQEHRRALPAGAAHPEPDSAFAVFHWEADAHDSDRDEVATDAELNLDEVTRVVSREDALVSETALAVAEPRALTDASATLEHEVDWEVEHERFHKRYVDARAAAAPPIHTLLGDLRDDPHALRRAILLAEVLGPPVGDR